MALSPSICLQQVACALFVAIIAVQLRAEEQLCRTINKPAFMAELVSVAGAGNANFSVAGKPIEVSSGELITWGALRDSPTGTHVLLADGSVLIATEAEIDGEELIVQSRLFGEVQGFSIAGTSRLPISAVRAIVFRAPLRSADRDALFKRLQASAEFEDQLWLANGDILKGTISRLVRESQDGNPGPVSVAIKTSAGEVEIRSAEPQGQLLEKVQAIVFNPALVRKVDADAPATLVGLADGTRLYAKQIEADGERATFMLASGAKLTSHPDENVWRRISSLQSFGSHVTYLSNLSPADYRHTPMLDRKWPLGVDESVTGARLRSDERMFVNGLGMHSSARAVYVLDRPYLKLEAELAIDQSAGDKGSVVFLVAHDADGKFKIAYKSPVVRGGEQPLPISLDISGARRIALFVEEADHGELMDRANWLNVRLIPAAE